VGSGGARQLVAAASAAPLLSAVTTTDDPTVNPALQGVLMAVGGFVGVLTDAFGAASVLKSHTGRWPTGF
jgi:hypothetical protein